jgi:hypothetical protein
LSESYWEEARKTACYVYNRSPGAHDETSIVSPYQQYYGVQPHISHLKIFGSTCYALNLTRNKGNHNPKAWPGIFVGYQDQQPVGLRIYLPAEDEFVITAHAEFEDHRVRLQGTNSVVTVSRYTDEEVESVGQKPDVSDGVGVESIGTSIDGDVICTSAYESQGKAIHGAANESNVGERVEGYGTSMSTSAKYREHNLPNVCSIVDGLALTESDENVNDKAS